MGPETRTYTRVPTRWSRCCLTVPLLPPSTVLSSERTMPPAWSPGVAFAGMLKLNGTIVTEGPLLVRGGRVTLLGALILIQDPTEVDLAVASASVNLPSEV